MGAGQKAQIDATRLYHLTNKEKVNQINKDWRERNKDKLKAQYERHKEKSKRGAACAILKQHEEDLKDDPDKLTLDFMKRIINLDCE